MIIVIAIRYGTVGWSSFICTTGSLESSRTEFGVGSASYYISNVECVGNEASFLDCNHEIKTQCGNNHIAGAVCTYNGECIYSCHPQALFSCGGGKGMHGLCIDI